MPAAETVQARRKRRSITTHRWFAAAVAAWFAALFGLCALVMPTPVLERAIAALHADAAFPAAAPPLGETARLLIAAAASSVGEILGLLLGRWLAVRGGKAPLRKPLSVADLPEAPAAQAPGEPGLTYAGNDLSPARQPPFVSAPLDALGAAQLSERLALALQSRRAHAAFAAKGRDMPTGEGGSFLDRARGADLADAVVAFPSVPTGTGEGTERAMQAALTSLRRISGAR